MTKKITLIFFITIYLLSLVAGFGFAGVRQANAITPASAAPRQTAWILVRVNDMTLEKPDLVSVWAMFLTYSPNPQVFFKPLFSDEAGASVGANLDKVFSVSADRSLSPDFFRELNRLISHQSGMVIMDETGFNGLTTWFTLPSTASENRPFVPQTGSVHIYNGETRNYYQICKTLENAQHPGIASLPWRKLMPNHILVYPSMLSLTTVWEKLFLSDIDTHCEVIPDL